ncbi:MAG: trehalose-phosphatase [Patescibacteria group bacterium]
MKYVFKNITEIENIIKKPNTALLLDFDLTLSPLAKNPNDAFLPKTTKHTLKKILAHIPVVIITGRKLSDIKKRIGIKNILYIGNHGLEHDFGHKYKTILSPTSKKVFLKTQKELVEKLKMYNGIIFEDKKYTFALGYRLIKKGKVKSLESILKKIKEEVEKGGLLEARLNKKTFEIRPAVNINKGTACRLALKILESKLSKKLVPIYIGDADTDEDAFRIFKRNGMAIRVGKNKKSLAKWYLRNQKEVSFFLKWLLSSKEL